jgi:hypothetical protein
MSQPKYLAEQLLDEAKDQEVRETITGNGRERWNVREDVFKPPGFGRT